MGEEGEEGEETTTTEEESREERAQVTKRWKGKHRKQKDFLEGRNGDSLMTPFECDLCIF